MPEKLKEFLRGLNRIEASEVLEYLDSNPDCVDEMVQVVAELVA